jgi:Derlin-2/3
MAQLVEDWYKQMPIITRSYLTLSVLTTVGCALEVISPLHVYLNSTRVVEHYEVWRLVSNFFYFGKLDLDFLFHMFFLARYCKLLEETSFRGRTADFFFMLLFGGSLLTTLVVAGGQLKFAAPFAEIIFLSNSLTFMMVYVWSKRNPHVQMSFLGLFSFTAPYLPWVSVSSISIFFNLQFLFCELGTMF